jgi:hypothetical protein
MDDPALAEVIRSLYSAGLLCRHPKTRMQPSTWQPRYSERLPSEARTKAARNVLVRNWRPQSAARSLFQRLPTTKRNTVYAHSHCHRPPRRDEAVDRELSSESAHVLTSPVILPHARGQCLQVLLKRSTPTVVAQDRPGRAHSGWHRHGDRSHSKRKATQPYCMHSTPSRTLKGLKSDNRTGSPAIMAWQGKTYFQIVRTDHQFLLSCTPLSTRTNMLPTDGAHDRTGEEAFRRGITVQYRPRLAKDSSARRSTRRSGTCTSSWTRINQRAGAFDDARRVWDKFGERQYQYHL